MPSFGPVGSYPIAGPDDLTIAAAVSGASESVVIVDAIGVGAAADTGAGRVSMRQALRFQPITVRHGGRIAAITVRTLARGQSRRQSGSVAAIVVTTLSGGQKAAQAGRHAIGTAIHTVQCGLQLVRPVAFTKPSRRERHLWAMAQHPARPVDTLHRPAPVDDDELALQLLEVA